jgi:hypothetical protein
MSNALNDLAQALARAARQVDILCHGFGVALEPSWKEAADDALAQAAKWERTGRVPAKPALPVHFRMYWGEKSPVTSDTLPSALLGQFHDKFLALMKDHVVPAVRTYMMKSKGLDPALFKPLLSAKFKTDAQMCTNKALKQKDPAYMSYLSKVMAEEARQKKQSPIEKSHGVIKSINNLVMPGILTKTDLHPEVQKAVDLLKKAHDKHSSVVHDESEKILASPRPSQNFIDKVKENMKALKALAGPGVQISEKTESVAAVDNKSRLNDKIIYSLCLITLAKGDKKYYVSMHEQWNPKQNAFAYDLENGPNLPSGGPRRDIARSKSPTIEPKAIEEDLIRTGFKEAKGKKADFVRVADKVRKKLQGILDHLRIKGCEKDLRSETEKRGDFSFERDYRYSNYDYDHGDIRDSDMSSIEHDVAKSNPDPKHIWLAPEFNSEKGYFSVRVGILKDAAQLLNEDPGKLEKEMKL